MSGTGLMYKAITGKMLAGDTLWIPHAYLGKCSNYRLTKSGGYFYRNGRLISEKTYDKWDAFYTYACDSVLHKADGHYCKFFLKDSVVFEEGLWHMEFFEGPYKAYFKDGKKRVVGQFSKDGHREGVWIFYNRKGKIKRQTEYRDGKEITQ